MAIIIVLVILFLGIIIAAGVFAYKSYDDDKMKRMAGSIVVAVVGVICFALIPFSIHTVNTGEIAVVKHLGEAKTVRTAGTYFDFWITESYQKYDAKVQNIDIVTSAYSSDAQTMDISMTLQYQIMSDHVMEIANQYGSLDILQNRLQSIAVEKSKTVLSSHKAMDIISNRSEMSPAVEKEIKNAIDESYFVNVTAVVLTNIDFSDAFELAVEEKMIAEQTKLKAAYENETKLAQVEAEATAKITAAEADAQAKTIAAEAEKTANELLEKSITDKILQKSYLDKWDGKLPNVISDGELNNMLPVNGIN